MSRLPPAQIPRPVMSPVLGVPGPGVGYVQQVTFNWEGLPGKPSVFPPAAHNHVVSDISGLQAALDGKQLAGSYVLTSDFTWANLSGKPSTFTPSAHGHVIADVSGLQTALDGKQPVGSYALTSHNHDTQYAALTHVHAISNISGLQIALDGKQDAGSYVTTANFTWANLSGKPTTFTPSAHSHVIGDVTGLQSALDGKQAAGSYLTTAGGSLSGPLMVASYLDTGTVFADTVSLAASGSGYITLHQGNGTYTGYMAFHNAENVRQGYIGFATTNGMIPFEAEAATGFAFNKAVHIQGRNVLSEIDGKASASHTHAYLPLTGGTLTGGFLNVSGSGTLPYVDLLTSGVSGGRSYRIRSGIEGVSNGGFSIRDLTSGVNVFNITDAGNVGLGITPNSGGYGRGLYMNDATDGVQNGLWSQAINTNDRRFSITNNAYNAGVALWKYGGTGMSSTMYETVAGAHIFFNAAPGTAGNNISWVERMKIDASGNLLVGTTSALSKLTVHQGADGYDQGIALSRVGADRGTIFLNATGNTMNFGRGSATHMTIDTSGNVGIGTAPDSRLHVVAGNTGLRVGFYGLSQNYYDADNHYFRTGAGSDRFVISGTSISAPSMTTKFNDITTSRGNGTGVVYLNDAQTRYLYFDGGKYHLPGSDLSVNGVDILSTLGTKVDLTSTQTIINSKQFVSANNTSNGVLPSLQAYTSDAAHGAYMSFHRSGYYAINMGLDSDNVFRIGGWSAPAGLMALDMSGNVDFKGTLKSNGLGVARWTTSGQTAANMTVSTASPSGGSDGDIWYKVAS